MNTAKALLEAGMVERFHCTPHHSPYSVAVHSWNMAVLLYSIYPGEPSRDLVRAVLLHDVAERWTGDVPYPMKHGIGGKVFNASLSQAERQVREAIGMPDRPLAQSEYHWLKGLDVLELLMFCHHEVAMGNTHVEQALVECFRILQEPWIPTEIMAWYSRGGWDSRCSDFLKEPDELH